MLNTIMNLNNSINLVATFMALINFPLLLLLLLFTSLFYYY